MSGAPEGNTNAAKKNRMLTDALRRELVQNPEDARRVARKTVDAAIAGEAWAQNLIYDRIDGKVPQPLSGDPDEPLIPKVFRIELVPMNGNRTDQPT